MPHNLSQSLPVIQMGSVSGTPSHLHVSWGFFLLLKHMSWAFRVGAVGLTHLGGHCKQQIKPIVQAGLGVISKTLYTRVSSL